MSSGDPPGSGYDPAWRSFEGQTGFVPHPSALEKSGALDRLPAYDPAPPATNKSFRRATMFSGAGNNTTQTAVPAPQLAALEDLTPKVAMVAAPADHAAVEAPAPQQWLEPVLHIEPVVAAIAPTPPHSIVDIGTVPVSLPPAAPDRSPYRVPSPLPTLPVAKRAALYRTGGMEAVPGRIARRPRAAWPFVMAGIGLTAALISIAMTMVPRMLAGPVTIKALFTAPMLVLRAVGPGEVTNVAVSVGQAVDLKTVLLTIHATPLGDKAVDDLKARLVEAQTRLTKPNDAPPPDRQRDSDVAEINQLQKAIASAGGTGTEDQPVVAGVRGVVWSLDAHAGLHLKAADPLAQLADCGRAFMVVRDNAMQLVPGQTVLIRLPNIRPFHGTVRASASAAEPPNTLVIDPTGFAAVAANTCPVGISAEVQPETRS